MCQSVWHFEMFRASYWSFSASTDEEGVVTIDGMMNYFGDLGVDIETAEVLVPVEIIQAPAMGVMTKESFINGWKANG